MNFIPAAIVCLLTPSQVEAIDDLEHNCDLINVRPHAYEVRWALERAGVETSVLDTIADRSA
mgnify:CR=1 FL=1